MNSSRNSSPSASWRSALTDREPERLNRLLAALASDQPAPAGGSAAAATVAIAAALLEKAARLSARHWSEAPAAVDRANRLRLDAEELVEADVQAYLGFVETRREARAGTASQAALAAAFEKTVTVPQAIVQAARAALELAGELAEHGNPNLRADAITAALLADAAGTAAAGLLAVNLAESSAGSAG